jgi:hypothetical protein
MPAVVQPDQNDDLSFVHSSVAPVMDIDFAFPEPTVTVSPLSRNKRQNALGAKSSTLFGNRQQDGSATSADGREGENLDSADASTNQSAHSYSLDKGWDVNSSEQQDALGLGHGQASARQDAADTSGFGRHDRLDGSLTGKSGGNNWPGQTTESALSRGLASQRQSVSEIIRESSRFSSQPDFYRPSQSFEAPENYGPGATSQTSGLGAREPDSSEPSHLPPVSSYFSEGNSRSATRLQDAMPEMRAWEAPASREPVFRQESRPDYAPPPPPPAPADHKARLDWPKLPGSLGN